ncbi:uncharacterized protein At5g08430-like [Cicer arietinum]|uniref:uncharacterized protein At5g08430-like n=1 Tax=Cicer arietinum TaxID=3827 RepID=UPI003CC57190
MRNDLLKQPTILELEQKAKTLHEDIIKHWISRELALLRNHIDLADEKGWSREYPFMMFLLMLPQIRKLKGQNIENC